MSSVTYHYCRESTKARHGTTPATPLHGEERIKFESYLVVISPSTSLSSTMCATSPTQRALEAEEACGQETGAEAKRQRRDPGVAER
jgi:hypothetical protein